MFRSLGSVNRFLKHRSQNISLMSSFSLSSTTTQVISQEELDERILEKKPTKKSKLKYTTKENVGRKGKTTGKKRDEVISFYTTY